MSPAFDFCKLTSTFLPICTEYGEEQDGGFFCSDCSVGASAPAPARAPASSSSAASACNCPPRNFSEKPHHFTGKQLAELESLLNEKSKVAAPLVGDGFHFLGILRDRCALILGKVPRCLTEPEHLPANPQCAKVRVVEILLQCPRGNDSIEDPNWAAQCLTGAVVEQVAGAVYDATAGQVCVLPSNVQTFGCHRSEDDKHCLDPTGDDAKGYVILQDFKLLGWKHAGITVELTISSGNAAIGMDVGEKNASKLPCLRRRLLETNSETTFGACLMPPSWVRARKTRPTASTSARACREKTLWTCQPV